MPTAEDAESLALICDAQGLIVAVLEAGLPLDHPALPGQPVATLLAGPSAADSHRFLHTLRTERAAIHDPLHLPLEGVLTPLCLAGSALGECFLIVGARSRSALPALFEKLLPTSPLDPRVEPPSNVAASFPEAVDALYSELSRVNNELVTMHRELAKKNVQLTQALEELAEADRRKNEAVARVAHELRNPLAPIQNTLYLLRLKNDAATVTQAADRIERQATQMARLIDELLDVTRISEGKVEIRWERLDLTSLLREVAEDCRPALEVAGLQLELQLPEASIWVKGDPGRLTQVVTNLLQNAAKFTEPGGRVSVRVRSDSAAQRAVIRVCDTGVGISAEVLPRIFEPFVQAERSQSRSRAGLGLGLALVKGIVALHGGEVRAASAGVGHGSEFTVLLPTQHP